MVVETKIWLRKDDDEREKRGRKERKFCCCSFCKSTAHTDSKKNREQLLQKHTAQTAKKTESNKREKREKEKKRARSGEGARFFWRLKISSSTTKHNATLHEQNQDTILIDTRMITFVSFYAFSLLRCVVLQRCSASARTARNARRRRGAAAAKRVTTAAREKLEKNLEKGESTEGGAEE